MKFGAIYLSSRIIGAALAASYNIKLYAVSDNQSINGLGLSSMHEGAGINYFFLGSSADEFTYDDVEEILSAPLDTLSTTVGVLGNFLTNSVTQPATITLEGNYIVIDDTTDFYTAKNVNDPYRYSQNSYAVMVESADGAIPIKIQMVKSGGALVTTSQETESSTVATETKPSTSSKSTITPTTISIMTPSSSSISTSTSTPTSTSTSTFTSTSTPIPIPTSTSTSTSSTTSPSTSSTSSSFDLNISFSSETVSIDSVIPSISDSTSTVPSSTPDGFVTSSSTPDVSVTSTSSIQVGFISTSSTQVPVTYSSTTISPESTLSGTVSLITVTLLPYSDTSSIPVSLLTDSLATGTSTGQVTLLTDPTSTTSKSGANNKGSAGIAAAGIVLLANVL